MFCYQCQETAKNTGCTVRGVCGKRESTAHLQDLHVYTAKGLARATDMLQQAAPDLDEYVAESAHLVVEALFTTVTNVNFDDDRLVERIFAVLRQKELVERQLRAHCSDDHDLPESVRWTATTVDQLHAKAPTVGVLQEDNEDKRSLRELATYGLKGIAAYADHAHVLGYDDPAQGREFLRILAQTTKELSVDELVTLVGETGNLAVQTMALLDRANTETYGNPEVTEVQIGVGTRPGILISGHDLKDMEELLEQTAGTGVDVYTHGEMLPANYYPAFKKYPHFFGNYGNSWWMQDSEFASFNGPVLMTTNCLTPPKESYRDRVYTTGLVAFPGVKHVADRPNGGSPGGGSPNGGSKDFSALIEHAKRCEPPIEIETGTITGGFAHAQVIALADKIVEAVQSGAVARFVIMGGCDGRQKGRSYFTEMAQALPSDTVILTAGCAKYRYNKLNLGTVAGIPRVLDAGQCNDSYSLAVIALKLQEILGVADINDLPIDFDIAWYEQKAITVLLALLALGFKGVRIGPTLPAFVSPGVVNVLVEKFDLKVTTTVEEDLKAIVGSAERGGDR